MEDNLHWPTWIGSESRIHYKGIGGRKCETLLQLHAEGNFNIACQTSMCMLKHLILWIADCSLTWSWSCKGCLRTFGFTNFWNQIGQCIIAQRNEKKCHCFVSSNDIGWTCPRNSNCGMDRICKQDFDSRTPAGKEIFYIQILCCNNFNYF